MVAAMRTSAIVVTLLLLAGCAGALRPPQLVAMGSLVYPDAARAEGTQGWVRVRYDIEPSGAVANAEVLAAEPAGIFDRAALDFVRSWRFRPVTRHGEAVVVRGTVSRIDFRMDEAAADLYP